MFIFQKRVEKMLERLHKQNGDRDAKEEKTVPGEEEEAVELEKHDRLAIALAGLLVLLPAVLLVCGVFFLMIWLFASRFAG